MNFVPTIRKYSHIKTGVSMIIIGLIATIFCSFIVSMTSDGDKVYAKTEGIITFIESTPVPTSDNGTDYEYTVLVDYTVDGTKYNDVEYNMYTSSMKVGDTVKINYNVDNPVDIKAPGSSVIIYIMLIISLGVLALGILYLVKGIKAKKEDYNDYNKVDMNSVSAEQIAEVENNNEPLEQYCFHFDSSFKQGYVMEDNSKRAVYEAKMVKFGLFTPFIYDFVNHYTLRTVTRKIGHVITTTFGDEVVPSHRSFKIDERSNWAFIADAGYSFEMRFDGISASYKVSRFGVEVADIKTVGTNAITGKSMTIGTLPVNGIFNVNCKKSDIDMVFIICFSLARAGIFEA